LLAFENLSRGAREQAAAAVRLAMAEVLAADHGGCLPVVFDDAFAYSDPERVNQLQRMLDHAANHGLQVIVLTCNPSDYAALGARTITLRPTRQASPAPGAAVPAPVNDEPETDLEKPVEENLTADVSPTVTDELRQALLDALPATGISKGNQSLRSELGWDQSTYNAVKQDLVAAGKLVPGRGRGGSVSRV